MLPPIARPHISRLQVHHRCPSFYLPSFLGRAQLLRQAGPLNTFFQYEGTID
jgi:hypothetical protein